MKTKYLLYAVGCGSAEDLILKKMLEEDLGLLRQQLNIISTELGCGFIEFEIAKITGIDGNSVVISVDSMNQEIVARAWDALLRLFIEFNGPVWVSTYSPEHLGQFGRIDEFKIKETTGYLMRPDAFDKMIS